MDTLSIYLNARLLSIAAPEIRAHCKAAAPIEAVGLIWDDGTIKPLFNQARSETRFVVGKTALNEALDEGVLRGRFPVALYHSHPTKPAKPSVPDKRFMSEAASYARELVFVICGTDGLRVWVWHGGNAVEIELVEES